MERQQEKIKEERSTGFARGYDESHALRIGEEERTRENDTEDRQRGWRRQTIIHTYTHHIFFFLGADKGVSTNRISYEGSVHVGRRFVMFCRGKRFQPGRIEY